jgi:hypothetical protein
VNWGWGWSNITMAHGGTPTKHSIFDAQSNHPLFLLAFKGNLDDYQHLMFGDMANIREQKWGIFKWHQILPFEVLLVIQYFEFCKVA